MSEGAVPEMVERVSRALAVGVILRVTPEMRRFAALQGVAISAAPVTAEERLWLQASEDIPWREYVEFAQDCLAAMREPTTAMVSAAMEFGWQPDPPNIGYDDAWRAMIDEAVK